LTHHLLNVLSITYISIFRDEEKSKINIINNIDMFPHTTSNLGYVPVNDP